MRKQFSTIVADSFEIYISSPENHPAGEKLNVVYYCDANLKSGRELRSLLNNNFTNLRNTLFVGIGHIGNYHVLRRRDFILPFITGKDTAGKNHSYGQTEKFYSFLKEEMIPLINREFITNADSNSILGHSLGGLFAFYCLFKGDDLFAKYFALSPALWIDKYAIYNFNNVGGGFRKPKYLYFAAGGREKINKILAGTNEANKFLADKRYVNLMYEYDVWKGQTHNSEVPLSLEKILREKL